jgi:hypothetical protein
VRTTWNLSGNKTPLTFLFALTFLFWFGYKGECNSKSNHLDNNWKSGQLETNFEEKDESFNQNSQYIKTLNI